MGTKEFDGFGRIMRGQPILIVARVLRLRRVRVVSGDMPSWWWRRRCFLEPSKVVVGRLGREVRAVDHASLWSRWSRLGLPVWSDFGCVDTC